MQSLSNMTRKQKTILLVAAFLVVYGLLVLFSVTNTRDIDMVPRTESNEIDYSDQAYIVDGVKLFDEMGSPEAYDAIGKDLFTFGKANYEKYKKENQVIGFEVTSLFRREGDTISFDGRFGANKNKIKVSVKLLNYGRLQTSITDTKTKSTMDDRLPSNSKRNQFIGKLPIETSDYVIEYVPANDSFLVNIFNKSSNWSVAENVIKDALGVESLADENVSGYGAGFPSPDNIPVRGFQAE